jgi:exopolysaccharide biosynthesis polyprenyl glycosylphosphotransferase
MKRYLLSYVKKQQYVLILGDICVLVLSILLSYVIRVYWNLKHPTFAVIWAKIDPRQTLVILAHLLTLYLLDQYNLNRMVNLIRSSTAVLMSVWLAGLIISGVFFFFPKYIFGRQVLLIHLGVVSLTMVLWRWWATEFLLKRVRSKALAVLGEGQIVSSFIEDLSRIPNSGFTVKSACILQKGPPACSDVVTGCNYYQSVGDLLASRDFDALAFDSANGSFSNEDVRLILELKHKGKAVYDLPTLYRSLTGRVPLRYIDGRWLLNSKELQGEVNTSYARAKRVIDVVLAGLLLMLLSPLFILIAAAIKLDGKGTVFFIQERLGIHRKAFKCVKFRSMVQNAESESGPMWSSDDDPRITRVGRVLRKNRLDELPQLWNVLKGDMSFVGPRPIREHFANELAETIPFYGLRFAVKPGLSGWAQVNHDYAGSNEGQMEKFQYELFYIQNMSLFLDVLTTIKTLHKIFRGGGI